MQVFRIKSKSEAHRQPRHQHVSGRIEALHTNSTVLLSAHVSEELIPLIEKAVAENGELKNALTERDSEIQRLKDDLNRGHSEDPQLVEQRLLHLIGRLKGDFRTMYEHQSTFFLEKIDLLKQEQRENIASLYKH